MDLSEYANIKNYEDSHWWYVSTHRNILRKLSRLAPHSRVLDAGCGTGGFLNRLNGQFKGIGFDASSAALRAASERPALFQRIVQALIEEIPMKSAQFDAVTCIDVIYHMKVRSEQSALGEIRRILKPGGYLMLQVPAFEILRGGHDRVVQTRRRYTMSEVTDLLREAGFKILSARYRFPWLFLPALIVRRVSRKSERSDLKHTPRRVNALLSLISRCVDTPLFYRLPFGTSVFAVGQKI